MPKLNRSLVASITADMQEFLSIEDELHSHLDKIQYLSWKYPTKLAKNVNVVEILGQHAGSAGELYILLLELTCDRVQYILRLILEYMEKHPSIEKFLMEMKDTDKPSYMTFGRTLRLLWGRHKVLSERISQNKSIKSEIINETYSTNKISQDFRTVEEVRYCESCVLASKTILQVIDVIEELFQESKLSSVTVSKRNYFRMEKNVIYEKSQWSVMNELTQAIAIDIRMICEVIRRNNAKEDVLKQNYEKNLGILQEALSRQRLKSNTIRVMNKVLRKRIKNGSKIGDIVKLRVPDVDRARSAPRNLLAVILEVQNGELYQLGSEQGKLSHLYTRNQFTICEEQFILLDNISDLAISLRECVRTSSLSGDQGCEHDVFTRDNASLIIVNVKITTHLKEARKSNALLKKGNKTLIVQLRSIRKETLCLTEAYQFLQSQLGILAESKMELQNTVSCFNKKINNVRNASNAREQHLQVLLTISRKENDTMKIVYEQKIKALQQEILEIQGSRGNNCQKCNKNMELFINTTNNEEVLQPNDDPELDMTRQFISNSQKIEALFRQNERLSKTLNRLREYRLSTSTINNLPK